MGLLEFHQIDVVVEAGRTAARELLAHADVAQLTWARHASLG